MVAANASRSWCAVVTTVAGSKGGRGSCSSAGPPPLDAGSIRRLALPEPSTPSFDRYMPVSSKRLAKERAVETFLLPGCLSYEVVLHG